MNYVWRQLFEQITLRLVYGGHELTVPTAPEIRAAIDAQVMSALEAIYTRLSRHVDQHIGDDPMFSTRQGGHRALLL